MRSASTFNHLLSETRKHHYVRRLVFFLIFFVSLAMAAMTASLPDLRASAVRLSPQAASDDSLAAVRRSDAANRDPQGKPGRLTTIEHLRRANVYMSNRAFAEAREHWQAVLTFYPQDPGVAEALLGIGRSYFQDRRYDEAFVFLDRVARNYPRTKEGREGLNFSASASLRMGHLDEAVKRYREYVEQYAAGERFESAHLNLIDTLREAGRSKEAIMWIVRTREKFAGTATATNALFARLRLDIAEGDWQHAISTAGELDGTRFQKGVLTTASEVAYLKAYSLEQNGKKTEAVSAYLNIPDGIDSYYGWLATERLARLAKGTDQKQRVGRVATQIAGESSSFPTPYRAAIIRSAKPRQLDPRFLLAIIKQESVFKPFAKSPSDSRGLLQLTMDAAQRYAPAAGLSALSENQLYRPETSILLGSEYLAELFRMFPNQPEAVAASYNGGEDNVARWIKRAKQKDPGVFTAEISFDETKGYVQKVMANYRAYQQLYNVDLMQR
jgi:soluble lytic murein transglycosylase